MKLPNRIAIISFFAICVIFLYYGCQFYLFSQEGNTFKISELREYPPGARDNSVSLGKNTTTERGRDVNLNKTNTHQKLKEIGVWGTNYIGKWYGEYNCTESGEIVRVIQTTDYRRLSESDVLFLCDASNNFPWRDFKQIRSPNQIVVYFSFESPLNSNVHHLQEFAYDIDWTFTYTSDATFPSPYGAYYPTDQSSPINETINWAKSKSGLVCALVSNCNTNWPRMKTIHQLASYIPIDIYGSCGPFNCPLDQSCNRLLSKYKFYLAFENSECRDYITEKFWHNALEYGIVPIVIGARPEDYERLAPPNSYIHVKNFTSLEKLAEYLKVLDQNNTLYNEYFQWKKRGYVKGNLLAEHYEPHLTMCRILNKLNNGTTRFTEDGRHANRLESLLKSCQ